MCILLSLTCRHLLLETTTANVSTSVGLKEEQQHGKEGGGEEAGYSLSSYFRAYVTQFDIPVMQEAVGEALAKINDTDVEAHPVNILAKSLDKVREKEKEGEEEATGIIRTTSALTLEKTEKEGEEEKKKNGTNPDVTEESKGIKEKMMMIYIYLLRIKMQIV